MTAPAAPNYPMRKVIRTGVSPMNPKVKWAQLECNHDIYLPRKPKVGSMQPCHQCERKSTS